MWPRISLTNSRLGFGIRGWNHRPKIESTSFCPMKLWFQNKVVLDNSYLSKQNCDLPARLASILAPRNGDVLSVDEKLKIYPWCVRLRSLQVSGNLRKIPAFLFRRMCSISCTELRCEAFKGHIIRNKHVWNSLTFIKMSGSIEYWKRFKAGCTDTINNITTNYLNVWIFT